MHFEAYIIVGRKDLPMETTVTAPSVKVALECVAEFLPGGSMWRSGDRGEVAIYIPGTDIPDDVARASGLVGTWQEGSK